MTLYLGIDGGGSGCRAALAGADGRILARAEAGPANIASDPVAALINILAVTHDVLEQAVGPAGVRAELPRLSAVLGLAGANVAQSVARAKAALPFARIRIETDAMIGVKGALQDADGIVAAIGTGSVFARQLGGTIHRIGGRGFVLGDEGSGAWLGRAVLSATLRAVDGFAPLTPLLQSLLDECGGVDGIIAFGFAARPADFAGYARRLVASDDPAAMGLMQLALTDIAASIALLQPAQALPVVFLGGLGLSLAPEFASRWDIRPALGSGLDGALWLALREGCAA